MVGSCSAAISSACHRQSEASMAYLKPAKWVVVEGDHGSGGGGGGGYYCLISFEDEWPVSSNLYAGVKRKEITA